MTEVENWQDSNLSFSSSFGMQIYRQNNLFKVSKDKRDVHVVLVSLLADQLSSQFLVLFWSAQKNVQSQRSDNIFLSTLLIF